MKKTKLCLLSIISILSFASCNIETETSSSGELSSSEVTQNSQTINDTSSKSEGTTSNENSNSSMNPISSSSESSSNVIINGSINVTNASGDLESCYAEWDFVQNADSYNVYYKENGTNDSSYKKIDDMLIRKYKNHMRMDIVGLKKGRYDIKIVALKNKSETNSIATFSLDVLSHIREGFGFVNGSASGAYNDDGTLKSNAKVIYVTSKNAKTVSTTINGTQATGLQGILKAKQKGDTTPLDIRIIGTINKEDCDELGSSSEGLQVKGKNAFSDMNITIEGIGNDASFKGFGMLIRNCNNVEVRNLGFLYFMDDGISIDTDNSHLWIHNNDFFYGQKGSAADQAKGDGSLDTKQSKQITHSFNHFFDSGKCNLQGMKSETTENTITYHHNWFDHSDSRHPRIRTCTVHIYNNYYDGNSKYGVGVTSGSSTLVEGNYFRHCKYPMLISKQGSDVANGSDGTFSGEDGGIIKAYNNHIESASRYTPYHLNQTDFDAYEVKSRDEKVPNSVKAKQGGTSYSNFDTQSTMYKYNLESPEEAKNTVTKYAGRVQGGDFKWTFTYADDTSSEVNISLKNAVANYTSSLLEIQGQGAASSGENPTPTPTPTPTDNDITFDFENGITSSTFKINGNTSTKSSITYNNKEYKTGLKMESSTSIEFSINKQMNLTLVFNSDFNGRIKIDGTKYNATNGILTTTLKAGQHTITKGDQATLFLIILSAN